jgi:hypothetical protein
MAIFGSQKLVENCIHTNSTQEDAFRAIFFFGQCFVGNRRDLVRSRFFSIFLMFLLFCEKNEDFFNIFEKIKYIA